jgi:CBS domain-containing protein
MSSPVTFVRTSDTMAKAAETLLEKGISGAAVVDHLDRAVGVITKTDFLRYEREFLIPDDARWRRGSSSFGVFELSARRAPQSEAKEDYVAHWMVPGVVAVEPSTPLREVGRIMAKKRIHRVFVQEDDRIVGIVTSLDALEALGRPAPSRPPAGRVERTKHVFDRNASSRKRTRS